ncbi:TetR/AcrR family transcriptional regulator [Micromonospora sp. NPDC047793]|uniref:TetR/AcrR family transcriptional regulator n=1 Tax=Micromonospora sp. NPDC047793 TaxID=3154342 RepID=UPI0026AD1A07
MGAPVTEGRQTRNAERTRRAVLDAATPMILERGDGITLAQVATAAGVSKSGLIHHFGSREQLVMAVVEDAYERFQEAVLSHLDLSENYPGKMLRAYVRALCAGSTDVVAARDVASVPIWSGLYAVPGIAAVVRERSEWWSEQLAADGLSAERVQLVRRAAEGVAIAVLHGEEDEASIATARRLLLDLATDGTFPAPI